MDDISREFPADAGGDRPPRPGRGRRRERGAPDDDADAWGEPEASDLPERDPHGGDPDGGDPDGSDPDGSDPGRTWDPSLRRGLLADRDLGMSDPLDPDAGGRGGPGGRDPVRRSIRRGDPGADQDRAAQESLDETAPDGDGISAADAARALAAAEDSLEIDDDDPPADGADGLPPVPELQDAAAVARIVFVLLLSQKEGLSLLRLAQACNTTQKVVEQALAPLQERLDQLQLPVDLARTGDTIRFLTRPEAFPFLQRLRGVKKLEKLSPAALETLAVVAYRQPVIRAEIEAIRGVKAGPMLRTLLSHKLVRVTGRADVPGRPLQYGTTQHFLERFGLSSLAELPSVKEWKQLG